MKVGRRIYFIVPFLILVLVFSLTGCTNPCESKEAKQYLENASSKYEIFMEKYKLANSTPRINLAPIIADMQDIKIEFNGFNPPAGCKELLNAHKIYLEGMNCVIDGYIAFQSQEDDLDVMMKFREAEDLFDDTEDIIKNFEGSDLFLNVRFKFFSNETSEESGMGEPKLKLLDYNFDREYDYIIVQGQVKNISKESLKNVEALVEFFDEDDNFIKKDSALIDYNPILSNQTSPFEVITTDNPEIARYRVSFKNLLDGKINHIK